MNTRGPLIMSVLLLCAAGAVPTLAQDSVVYSPYVSEDFPKNVYFGDTHLHTSFSTDAGMVGNIRGPEDTYRLARGETIISSFGLPVKLSRPLDFLVIERTAAFIN